MAQTTPTLKRCTGCQRDLPLDDYYRDGSRLRAKCKRCHIDAVLARQRANPDADAAYQAAYRARNRESARARTARWRADNPERVVAAQVSWRSDPANRQSVRDRARAFRVANPQRRAEYERRRRAWKKSKTIGFIEPAQLDAKIAYWGNRCWICRAPWEQIDHVKPLSKGGAHVLCNLRPICRSCNARKNDRWPYRG